MPIIAFARFRQPSCEISQMIFRLHINRRSVASTMPLRARLRFSRDDSGSKTTTSTAEFLGQRRTLRKFGTQIVGLGRATVLLSERIFLVVVQASTLPINRLRHGSIRRLRKVVLFTARCRVKRTTASALRGRKFPINWAHGERLHHPRC